MGKSSTHEMRAWPRQRAPLLGLMLLAVPSWQEGLPRTSTVRATGVRRAVSSARTLDAEAVTRRRVARAQVGTLQIEGAPAGRVRSTNTAQSVGTQRPKIGAINLLKPAQENELLASAQFFVEQHARNRLLEQLWLRKPSHEEWALASLTFNYVDSDGNGRVEASELAAIVSGHFDTLCPELFLTFDESGEGYLDFAAYARITAYDRGLGVQEGGGRGSADKRRDGAKARRVSVAGASELSSELCGLGERLASDCARLHDFDERLRVGEAALKYLIRANQGMVHQVARQLRPRGDKVDMDDMLQDGNMGLMQAIVRFEPTAGCRLSTYSYSWIRGLIMTGLHRRLNQVNLPSHVAQDVFKLRKLLRESAQRLISVQPDELLAFAKKLNWDETRLKKIVTASTIDTTHCLSFETSLGTRDGSEWALGDTVSTPDRPATDEFVMTIDKALEFRVERNARIIRLRFGLEDGLERTYNEIAQIVGISPQRVCSVVNDELRYLKDTRALRAYKDGFDYAHK
ncbi:hypothetical protein T492DRAFT_1024080 [Pavlovales sp. CCMP2436]|nr:hypothetical protein T492DRAFT_1024080 [Pavlovales sp. CCMP2436]